MNRMLGLGLAALAAASMTAQAETRDAKSDVIAAAKKLAEQANYSWTSTPKSEGAAGGGQGQRAQPGPTEGKTEKDGCTLISSKQGETTTEAALKGEKVAVKTADGWKAGSELQPAAGGGQQGRRDPAVGMASRLKTFKAPAADAQALVELVAELKEEDGALAGALSEQGAKDRMSFGGRGGNAQRAPQIADPKGSAKFWIKDGVLVKYEYKLSGKMTVGQNNQEIQINRTTTVEIKDVGTTKVEVPEDAKKKLE